MTTNTKKEQLLSQLKNVKVKPISEKGYMSKSMLQISKEQEKKSSGSK